MPTQEQTRQADIADRQRADALAGRISQARRAGYSDDEIADELGKSNPKISEALGHGYTPDAVFKELVRSQSPVTNYRAQRDSETSGVLDSAARARENKAQPKRGVIAEIGADLAKPFEDSKALNFAGQEQSGRPGAANYFAGKGKSWLGAAGVVASPVSGLINAVTAPMARGLESAGIGDEQANNLNINLLAAPLGAMVKAPEAANAFAAASRVRAPAGVNALAKAVPDVAAARALATSKQAMGLSPALVDVMDQGGRDLVGAAALRNTPGRQVARDFARARSEGAPGRVSAQAREVISSDPRNPRQIAEELGKTRKTQADAQYGAVREDRITLTPEATTALRSDYGRQAIREAAARERDADTKRALMGLADHALDQPGEAVTVGMMDRVSRVLLGKASAAKRAGDNDLEATYNALGHDVRKAATDVSGDYTAAVGNYKAQSDLIDAADRGGDFLKRNTDEFVADAAKMTPDQAELARATARRAVESASGENISAAPGVMRKLAYAPEQLQRNNALLGVRDAQALQDRMKAELDALDAARAVDPRAGSPTTQKLIDQQSLDHFGAAVKGIGAAARGDVPGVIHVLLGRLKTLGMSDQQAEEVVRLATDPARLEDALNLIERSRGIGARRRFVQIMHRAARRTAAVGTPANAAGAATRPPTAAASR